MSSPTTPHLAGLAMPSEVTQIIEHAQCALEATHRENQSMLKNLLTPLCQYVDKGDVVRRLAIVTEENEKLYATSRHLPVHNRELQATINLYKEKEAIAAASY